MLSSFLSLHFHSCPSYEAKDGYPHFTDGDLSPDLCALLVNTQGVNDKAVSGTQVSAPSAMSFPCHHSCLPLLQMPYLLD